MILSYYDLLTPTLRNKPLVSFSQDVTGSIAERLNYRFRGSNKLSIVSGRDMAYSISTFNYVSETNKVISLSLNIAIPTTEQ